MSEDWVSRLAGRAAVETTSAASGTPAATIEDLAVTAARAADDKLGRDTVILAVGDVLAITDFFVITHGANDRQVRTIVEDVERALAETHGVKAVRVEGLDTLKWVLIDFGSFVVHVFDEETRRFYDLERLWRDVPRVEFR